MPGDAGSAWVGADALAEARRANESGSQNATLPVWGAPSKSSCFYSPRGQGADGWSLCAQAVKVVPERLFGIAGSLLFADSAGRTDVALITSFTEKKPERDTKHSEVEATWHIAEHGGLKYLQIDTYGSSERLLAGKVSQSIRLDARAANQLRALIDRAFD